MPNSRCVHHAWLQLQFLHIRCAQCADAYTDALIRWLWRLPFYFWRYILKSSGGGTCHRHKNRALGDTFLKFGMVLSQAMRFSKTTGYKLAHAANGCSCEKNKTANDEQQIRHASASMDCSFKYNTILCYFWVWGMVVDTICPMS